MIEIIKEKLRKVENITYHQYASDQKQYIEEYGKNTIGQQKLSMVGHLILDRFNKVTDSIEKGDINVSGEHEQQA
jgi:hypothetical protein